MKRYIWPMIGILAVALVFSGCSSNGGGDEGGSRVNKPTSSELSSYEGSTPTSDAEAKALFAGAVEAATVSIESGASASVVPSGRLSPSATETVDETFSGTINGDPSGTIDLEGVVTGSYTEEYPEGGSQEGDYLFDVTMDLDFGADFNEFAFTEDSTDYVLDGLLEVNSDIDWNIDATVTSDSITGSYSYDYGFGLVYALTVDDITNGQGGKFILYVDEGFGDSGDLSNDQALESVNPTFDATLELYDNNDELVRTVTLTRSEALGLFPFVSSFLFEVE